MEKKCKDLVRASFESRMSDIRAIVKGETKDKYGDDLPPLNEYGLGIDVVPARTFDWQNEGYTRYQLSWGGPSEEFRVFTTVPRVEFWYLHWFDGAHITLNRKDANIIRKIVGKKAV